MSPGTPPHLPQRKVVLVFLAFALAFFLSSLIRAITATLSPNLTAEFKLSAQDLGLLAGGYFLGFSLTQLPLGRWLDRYGPKRVILAFLSLAVVGCLAFSMAESFYGLLAARVLSGMGLSACLMAPLMAYRRWFDPQTQLRANSWMLMTGSTGMLAATLPVQWFMPLWGWRPLFVMLGGLVVVSMVLMLLLVPRWQVIPAPAIPPAQDSAASTPTPPEGGYRVIWRSPYFWRMVPIGFFCHGGMVAIQTLWAGQWMTQVAGKSTDEAALGLFLINLGMLGSFWMWGLTTPRLIKARVRIETLITGCLPLTFAALVILVSAGPHIGVGAAATLTLFCMSSSVVSLIQPAMGLKFPAHLAGRALSSYNLVVLTGIFCTQWGIGLIVDAALAMGLSTVTAYRVALSAFLMCSFISWMYFALRRVRPGSAPKPLNPEP